MNDRHLPTESELAALADGSLPPDCRERMLAAVREHPELSAMLAVQERAVKMTRSVDVKAPASLHQQISSMYSSPPRRRFAWLPRPALAGALASGLAALAAVLVLTLGQGGRHSPSLAQISALTLGQPTLAAPAESSTDHTDLTVSVEGIAFPYWGAHLGWHSTGRRIDHLGASTVTTVFYKNSKGQRVGYAILAGAAPAVSTGTVIERAGVPYRLLSSGGVTTVTWHRDGHLCVVSGRGVSGQTLVRLASWEHPETSRT